MEETTDIAEAQVEEPEALRDALLDQLGDASPDRGYD